MQDRGLGVYSWPQFEDHRLSHPYKAGAVGGRGVGVA